MCKSQDLNLRRKQFEPSARDVRQYIGEQGERAKVAEQSLQGAPEIKSTTQSAVGDFFFVIPVLILLMGCVEV